MWKVFPAFALATLLLAGPCFAQQSGAAPAPSPQQPQLQKPQLTLQQKVSYGIGLSLGRSLKRDGLEVDPKLVLQGLQDGLAGREPLVSLQELQAAFQQLQAQLQAKQQAALQALAKKNLEEGQRFLENNKKRKGVVTLKSGLQYEVLKSGNGPSPKPTDVVRTHYVGKLIDGTVFDSSVARGEPATFRVDRVIKGWSEALQLMKVGDKWRIYIPADLAYGGRGVPPRIGPNSVLIFDVELLGIEQKQQP